MDILDKYDLISKRHSGLLEVGDDPFAVRMERVLSATEALVNGRPTILAGTNNYLGLTFDPACIAAGVEAMQTQGTGTTGSRIANGTYAGHRQLEADIADFFGFASALVFPTGYQANLGVISALAGREDYILMDADCHACIYDGCRMTDATVIRFRHNNPADLEKRLQRLDKESAKTKADIGKSEAKLANEKFVAKAPPEVVETERQRVAEHTATLDKLKKARQRLDSVEKKS